MRPEQRALFVTTDGVPAHPDPCPGGCGRTIRAGLVLCGWCWPTVPAYARELVKTTFRAYQAAPTEAAWDAYAEARKIAIAEVRR